MYIPPDFLEDDQSKVESLIRAFPFGMLVSCGEGVPVASHVPFLVEQRGDARVLIAHVARANPQWQMFDGEREALAIFQGPHGYISPNWYASEDRVPTWNYAAVHVYGAPHIVGAERTQEIIVTLTQHFESSLTPPWQADELPSSKLKAMLGALVAFEIPMSRVEGKWKLGQNRSAADRAGAAAGVEAMGGDLDLAALMCSVAKA